MRTGTTSALIIRACPLPSDGKLFRGDPVFVHALLFGPIAPPQLGGMNAGGLLSSME
jgi:hypothetical protein